MCTVSYYASHEKVVITSNRDESIYRPLAMHPKWFIHNNIRLCYPIDPLKGGSWFIVNGFGSTFVLLNGGQAKHASKPPYRLSRGLILIDIASSKNWQDFWVHVDLLDIEPFTLIVYDNNTLHKCLWDGNSKYASKLDAFRPHIWSSVTLYDLEIIEMRKNWFSTFLERNSNQVNEDQLLDFHSMTKREDLRNGLVIYRNGEMLTKNITQVILWKEKFTMIHHDLITKQKSLITEFIL